VSFFGKRVKSTLLLAIGGVLPLVLLVTGCMTSRIACRPPRGRAPMVMMMEVTGYCNCGDCCSWYRPYFYLGSPIISSGVNRGKPKAVGMTASGTRACQGTIAADTTLLPFGTIVKVPGYGYGRVEDRGGAIKGMRLDLWYPSHDEAKEWGRRRIFVEVWKP